MEKGCPKRGLEEPEKNEGKWKRTEGVGRRREKTEGRAGRYHQGSGAAAAPGPGPEGPGQLPETAAQRADTRGGAARSGAPGPWAEPRRPAGSGRRGWMRAAQAGRRGRRGSAVGRDIGRQERCEGGQEPARAGGPEGRLGPGKGRTEPAKKQQRAPGSSADAVSFYTPQNLSVDRRPFVQSQLSLAPFGGDLFTTWVKKPLQCFLLPAPCEVLPGEIPPETRLPQSWLPLQVALAQGLSPQTAPAARAEANSNA